MHIDRSEKQIGGLRLRKHLRLVEPNIFPLRILYTLKPVPITRSETELESEIQEKRNINTCYAIWFKGRKLSIVIIKTKKTKFDQFQPARLFSNRAYFPPTI